MSECMCLAFDADSNEEGWRPCPPHLCEVEGHEHFPDWLVVFARSVALERERCARMPGHVFCVMLPENEATRLLEQVCELVGVPVCGETTTE
jgi:hypothetical protein